MAGHAIEGARVADRPRRQINISRNTASLATRLGLGIFSEEGESACGHAGALRSQTGQPCRQGDQTKSRSTQIEIVPRLAPGRLQNPRKMKHWSSNSPCTAFQAQSQRLKAVTRVRFVETTEIAGILRARLRQALQNQPWRGCNPLSLALGPTCCNSTAVHIAVTSRRYQAVVARPFLLRYRSLVLFAIFFDRRSKQSAPQLRLRL